MGTDCDQHLTDVHTLSYTHGAMLPYATAASHTTPRTSRPVGGSLHMNIATKPGAFLSHDESTKYLLVDVTVANLIISVRHFVSSTRRGGHALRTANNREKKTHTQDIYILIALPVSLKVLHSVHFPQRRRGHLELLQDCRSPPDPQGRVPEKHKSCGSMRTGSG